jgi:hypothetical protein
MASAPTTPAGPAGPEPGGDLPPVQPPSGRFLAQLFLVPGLIVFFVVLLVLAINYLFVSGHSADQFLKRLDSDNADIRWRGANDLAQVLKRRESLHLKTDVAFALDLVERLDKALDELVKDEQTIGAGLKGRDKDAKSKGDADRAYDKLKAQRNLVEFLASALGDFHIAAGVPVLCDIIVREDSPDVLHQTSRRRKAVWSLGNLGVNMKAFTEQLKPEQQQLVISKLKEELESDKEWRRRAAKTALFYLGEVHGNDSDVVHADAALAKAAEAKDIYLREQVAFVLNFWDGPQTEPTLLRLSEDRGEGTLLRTPEEP